MNFRDLWGLEASDGNQGKYTIKSGDTLSQITQKHNNQYGTNYSPADLAEHNGISNPDLIYPGTTLNLPVPTPCPYDFSGSGSGPGVSVENPNSQQNSGPVITIGFTANLVFGVGGDVSIGVQFDLGNPNNSGIVTSAGFASGTSIGAGGFLSISSSSGNSIVTGATNIRLSSFSVSGTLNDDGGAISFGYGQGFGLYTSKEYSNVTSFSDFGETFMDSLSTLNSPY